ncbi:MAG TPA: class I SAM-dependent methyltransferase [Chloroflexota bacterium]|nr:class I SAM-dependent methyltransferase [Chloroflexota bacterium]
MRNLVYDVQRYYRTVAPFMEAELAGRGDEALWRQVGRQYRAGRILEIGCGGGRVTAMLAQAGARVLGIDLSPELLRLAQPRLAGASASLLLADVRQLALRTKFEAIVAPDDPFSHLTSSADRDRALRSVAAHLAPEGRFLLDALWFPDGKAGKVDAHDMIVDGRLIHVTEHWRCNSRTHRCATEYNYDSGAGEPAHARFEARYWTPPELCQRFERAGLRITQRWGSYDGQPWDERRSGRLVVEATTQVRAA